MVTVTVTVMVMLMLLVIVPVDPSWPSWYIDHIRILDWQSEGPHSAGAAIMKSWVAALKRKNQKLCCGHVERQNSYSTWFILLLLCFTLLRACSSFYHQIISLMTYLWHTSVRFPSVFSVFPTSFHGCIPFLRIPIRGRCRGLDPTFSGEPWLTWKFPLKQKCSSQW